MKKIEITKLQLVKFVAKGAVGAGTSTISKSIIENNVQPENFYQKVTVYLATAVIASMAVEATKTQTDARIDQMAAQLSNLKSMIENANNDPETETA